jgi:hypothetical protein
MLMRMIALAGKPNSLVWVILYVVSMPINVGLSAELAGVTVRIDDYDGPATLQARLVDRYRLEIAFDPKTETQGVVMRVDLPAAGPNTWPAADVEVLDSEGQPIPVRRPGIEWHKLQIAVPPKPETFVVHPVDVARNGLQSRPERERHATDPKTGVSATICRWYDGRKAALSIRFDDSHPTHLSTAIPILNEYGFRGTFMVNPGGPSPDPRRRSAFQDHLGAWQAVAQRGRHEFANHTLDHRGAHNDEETEHQIGAASKAIWELFPDKSKLVALNLGGGTWWTTTRTLRFYLEKYHLFDASSGSTGMDDVYGNRLATFRRLLEKHLERGGWYRTHYHSIGPGHSSSEANFRSALDIAQEHESKLWIAGMADIYKYLTERRGATLALEHGGPDRVDLHLSCSTPAELYDQPLTIEVTLPASWPSACVTVRDPHNKTLATRSQRTNGAETLRFEITPCNALYHLLMTP